MSYCVHCGVELEAGTAACPLCQTPVSDPNAPSSPSAPPPLYPPIEPISIPKVSRRVIFLLCAIFHLIPAFVTLTCDLSLNGEITWSAFVLGAVAALLGGIAILLYADIFRAFGKVLSIGGVWALFTFFVEYWIHGTVRIPFALPLVVYATLMLALLCFCGRYPAFTKHPLRLIALTLLAIGGFCVLIEWCIFIYFGIHSRTVWSAYPAGASLLLAAVLLVIDRSSTLRAKLKKKLFI